MEKESTSNELEDIINEEFKDDLAEFDEENLEEVDDDLICSICLDLLYNPLCTQ